MTTNNPLATYFTPQVLLRFALPNVVMMIFLSLYTIIDGMFISRLVGALALSATNMFYPVTSVQLGIGIMLGTGGSAIIAQNMGAGRHREAKQVFTFLTAFSAAIGCLLALLCLFFLKPILLFLGTSPLQLPDCYTYAFLMLCFSPLMFLQVLFQSFFVTAGKPQLGLGLTVLGGIANMVLDYLFMGPLQMGVAGAAIATGIGYSVPALVGLVYFSVARRGTLYFVRAPLLGRALLRACANGASEMVSNVAIAVTTFLFNLIFLYFWAENGVATIAILSYFQFVFSAIFMGFSMGIAPVISYKYGAQDHAQLQAIFRFSIRFILLSALVVYVLARLTIRYSLILFTDVGSPVYTLSMEGFGIYALQIFFMGINIFASAFFTALGNGGVSATISISRTFIFLVGSLLLLPSLFGQAGVWFAVPLAELLGILVSIGFLCRGRKRYRY